jgi:hypothetical protein
MKPFHPYILVATSCVLPSSSGLPEAMSWRDASHVIPCASRGSLPSDVDVVDLQPTSPVKERILRVTCNSRLGGLAGSVGGYVS